MNDIFISYSSKDIKQAEEVRHFLKCCGFECWFAKKDLPPGVENYPASITRALRDSRSFLLLVSRDSIQSKQVENEVSIANNMLKHGMKIFAILLDDTLDPEHLSDSFDYVLAGRQVCRWSVPSERRALAGQIAVGLGKEDRQAEIQFEEEVDEFDEFEQESTFAETVGAVLKDSFNGLKGIAAFLSEIFAPEKSAGAVKRTGNAKTLFSGKAVRASSDSMKKTQWIIGLLMVLLFAVSVLMISSVSVTVMKMETVPDWWNGDMFYQIRKQAVVFVLGMLLLVGLRLLSVSAWKRLAPYVCGISVVTVLLLKTPFGVSVNGVTRWLSIGPVQFRPAEFAIFGFSLGLALLAIQFHGKIEERSFITRLWVIGAVMGVFLNLFSDHVIMAVYVLGMTFCMTLIFTGNMKFHILTGVAVVAVFALRILYIFITGAEFDFRAMRLMAWLDPYAYENAGGYVTVQALEALKSTGFFGKGFGKGDFAASIPDIACSDEILITICEEFGYFGAFVVLVLFVVLFYQIYRVMRVALVLKIRFGAAMVLGVGAHLLVETVVNVAISFNLLPDVTCSLPFVSYYGFSGIFRFMEIACVLAVARECQEKLLRRSGRIVGQMKDL